MLTFSFPSSSEQTVGHPSHQDPLRLIIEAWATLLLSVIEYSTAEQSRGGLSEGISQAM